MKKLLANLVALASIFYFLSSNIYAQYGQYGQYGGPGPSLFILIDKMVGKPTATKGGFTDLDYVDNLSPSDPRFSPNQEVFFRLKVKNTSNVTLNGITVKDYLPTYIEPVEGQGTYDSNSRTITISAGDFAADEEKVFYIKTKFVGQNQLPADKGLICVVNKAQAYNNNVSDDDTAQFCVEKQVQGVVKVPAAGPEMGAVLLAGEGLILGFGLLLKKKSR